MAKGTSAPMDWLLWNHVNLLFPELAMFARFCDSHLSALKWAVWVPFRPHFQGTLQLLLRRLWSLGSQPLSIRWVYGPCVCVLFTLFHSLSHSHLKNTKYQFVSTLYILGVQELLSMLLTFLVFHILIIHPFPSFLQALWVYEHSKQAGYAQPNK